MLGGKTAMAPKFGTSGLRGLVTELTDDLVADYTRAFLLACDTGAGLAVGEDLRPSSPAIARAVTAAATGAGMPVVRLGQVPTPALALAAMGRGMGAVMVTGSHIPADRNGLKFYLPTGEIGKEDEAAITAHLGRPAPEAAPAGTTRDDDAGPFWRDRYVSAFGPEALAGLRVGVWDHSSVARDLLHQTLRALGAETVGLARSDTFVPVDTEAVDPGTRARLAAWAEEHRLDALVSTDGDGDRPLVAGPGGRILPGDVLGPLTARALGAGVVVTPVSSNGLVDGMGFEVVRTRIGSPFVIAGMEARAGARVVGYEANGGFLLGFEAAGPAGLLPPLMTRDCLLPIVAPLAAARAEGRSLLDLAAALPPRFTAADRLQGIDPEAARAFLAGLQADEGARAAFFEAGAPETGLDLTDGLRVRFGDQARAASCTCAPRATRPNSGSMPRPKAPRRRRPWSPATSRV